MCVCVCVCVLERERVGACVCERERVAVLGIVLCESCVFVVCMYVCCVLWLREKERERGPRTIPQRMETERNWLPLQHWTAR